MHEKNPDKHFVGGSLHAETTLERLILTGQELTVKIQLKASIFDDSVNIASGQS